MITANSNTLGAERLERILAMLATRPAIRVDELCAALHVSSATVRRDLKTLNTQGRIRKVHGGAVSVESRLAEPRFEDKATEADPQKRAIAVAARALIQPNACIYLDGGSTVLALAELLTGIQPLTVVTNSLRVAMALAGASPRLMLVGGELRRLSQTFVGPLTQPLIEQLHVDMAFMGSLALSLADGLTTTDPAEAFTKRLIMQHASQVILLADSGKFGKVAFANAGHWKDVHALITDDGLAADTERQLARTGVAVTKVAARATKEH